MGNWCPNINVVVWYDKTCVVDLLGLEIICIVFAVPCAWSCVIVGKYIARNSSNIQRGM